MNLLDFLIMIRFTKKEIQVVKEHIGQTGNQDVAGEEKISEKNQSLKVDLISQRIRRKNVLRESTFASGFR